MTEKYKHISTKTDGKKRWLAVLLTVLTLAWMLVIFLFSAQPDTESAHISGSVSYQIVSCMNEVFHMQRTPGQLEMDAYAIDFPVRKAAHMSEYAILAVLLYAAKSSWCTAWGRTVSRKRRYWTAVFLAAVYACTDEGHQLFVPGRAGRITDVMIDTAGAAIGLGIVCGLVCLVTRKRANR